MRNSRRLFACFVALFHGWDFQFRRVFFLSFFLSSFLAAVVAVVAVVVGGGGVVVF